MEYFIDPDGNYPRHYGDIQIEHPDWKMGDQLPNGWQSVAAGVFPEIPQDHKAIEHSPALVNGVLTRQFEVVPYTADELKQLELMKIRKKVTNGETLTSAEAKLLVG